MANAWLTFIRDFYASERRRDPSKCRNSGTLKRVSKIYKCKQKLYNRTARKTSKFSGKNPMHKKSATRRKNV